MLVDTSKENLCINKLISKKKEIIFVEKDMIVPDAKPDILSTICTSGEVCVYKKEVLDDKIKIDGSVNACIMYLADNSEDKVRGINACLDFSENISVTNCKEGMDENIELKLKSIECKVINGRKIGIKATIEVFIEIYSNENVEIVNNIENNDNIQMLKEDINVNSLVGIGETKIYSKENISIQEIDNLAEILKSEVMICDKDIKISYNKVLTKAEAKIKVMYLTEDNRIGIAEGKIPIVGFIDIPNVTDGNICNSNYEIKNIVMKPNSTEEHSIYVEMEVQVKCMVYEEKQINLIQDMYSPCEKLSFTKKQITTMINIRKIQETQKVKEIVSVNDIENKKLIDADVKAEVSNTGRMSDSKTYDGELTCNFTFLDDNMNVELKTVKIPFEHSFKDISENCNSNFDLQVTNQDFIVQDGGNISCNIDMLANGTISENKTLNIIDDVQSEDDDDNAEDYSVVVYIVKKGDTLWNIAKRFRTTVDFIVRTNGIENPDVIDVGQKLYIPRYSKMSVNYA